MAMSITKVTLTVGTATFTKDVSAGAVSFDLPASLRGETATISCTQTGGTGTVTASPESLTLPASATSVTFTDSTAVTPLTATVSITADLEDGAVDKMVIKNAGWFKFRRRELNVTYKTGQNGVVLPGARIKEIIAIQAKGVVSFEFNYATQKVTLYQNATTECTNNKDIELAVLCILE